VENLSRSDCPIGTIANIVARQQYVAAAQHRGAGPRAVWSSLQSQ
jgi:hypothetical protein